MADTLTTSDQTNAFANADTTIAFYDADPQAYANGTLSSDLSHLYPAFLERVVDGGRILDAGCGAGRDIVQFFLKGYQVDAFDASVGLARLAGKLTGVDVEVTRFEDWVSRPRRYDGIWCFASLLHVDRVDLTKVLSSLALSLRPGAPIFASFKWGERDTFDVRGRQFTNFTSATLGETFEAVSELTGVEVWGEEGPTALDDATRWLYVMAIREA